MRGTGDPVIAECDGTYTHDSRRPALLWSIPVVDADNASGSMEFSAGQSVPLLPSKNTTYKVSSICDNLNPYLLAFEYIHISPLGL